MKIINNMQSKNNNNLKKNLLVVFIYKKSSKFFFKYFNSVKNQNTNNFDLLMIHDNYKKKINYNLKINNYSLYINTFKTVAELRYLAIKYAEKNNYKTLIFSDIDDSFSDNRISQSIKYLKKYDFVVNELSTVHSNKHIINKNIINKINKYINIKLFSYILNYNIYGLSNTAINLNLLNDFYIPKDTIAIDWWIFSLMIINNKKSYFIKNSETFYLQHIENTIGFNKNLTSSRIFNIYNIKKIHYSNLLKYCKKNRFDNYVLKIKNKLKNLEDLKIKFDNKIFLKNYINFKKKSNKKIYGWWDEF